MNADGKHLNFYCHASMVTNNRITIKMECLVFTELPTHFFTGRLNVTNSSAYNSFQKLIAVLFPLFTRP